MLNFFFILWEFVVNRALDLLKRAWPKTLFLAALLLIGLALGFIAATFNFPSRAAARIERDLREAQRALGLYEEPDVRPVAMRQIETTLHHLVESTIDIGEVDGGRGGTIAEYGDNIIFVKPKGHVGFVSYGGEIHQFAGRVPMHIDTFLKWLDTSQAGIFVHYFRTMDAILIQENGADHLYVSYQRFDEAGSCIRVVVSRIGLHLENRKPVLSDDGWQDVFIANPCVPLPPQAPSFEGIESGGRLVQQAPGHLLLTTGHFGFDGRKMLPAVSQDAAGQLGKILDIDITAGTARTISMGHRNPQGLTVDVDGHIWETEHGPQGGDEINLILDGRNYGWPFATDGLEYGDPDLAIWPTNPEPGRHDPKYERPVYFFSPSIGISNLVQIEGAEFPRWKDDFLIGSLSNNILYRFRMRDGAVRSMEEIPLGERVRDVIRLRGGRFALYLDSGKIAIFERRRAAGEPSPYPPLATNFKGYAAVIAARRNDPTLGRQLPFEEQGRRLFAAHCASCHSVDGSPKPGPDLRGVQDRTVASLTGFSYSTALRGAGGHWDYDRLSDFIANPQKKIPGTTMKDTGIHAYDTHAVLAYLATLR